MIKNLFMPTMIFLGFVAISALPSCSSQEESDRGKALRKNFDDDLAKISPGLALIKAQNALKVQVNCLLADTFEKSAQENLLSSSKHRTKCKVFKKALAQTSKLSEIAKKNGKPPDDAFLFYACGLHSEGEELAIGLFETIEDCQLAEKAFRDEDICTRPCRLWTKEPYFYL